MIAEKHILKPTDTSNYRVSKHFVDLYSCFRDSMFLQVSMKTALEKNVNQKVITGKFSFPLF